MAYVGLILAAIMTSGMAHVGLVVFLGALLATTLFGLFKSWLYLPTYLPTYLSGWMAGWLIL
ncbi:hypothetical protein T492DRAFT_881936 [Pavlovales sp. CCMP2436]|nr:hypothetical protein T492DRAFT_881936 [Pavlovales sp. CCMP2436]